MDATIRVIAPHELDPTVARGSGDDFLNRIHAGDEHKRPHEHRAVTIEKRLPRESGIKYPRCTAGKRACPPEDCGGAPGYGYLLYLLDHPEHEEYEERMEWLGGPFDPEKFDLEAVNRNLAKLNL